MNTFCIQHHKRSPLLQLHEMPVEWTLHCVIGFVQRAFWAGEGRDQEAEAASHWLLCARSRGTGARGGLRGAEQTRSWRDKDPLLRTAPPAGEDSESRGGDRSSKILAGSLSASKVINSSF